MALSQKHQGLMLVPWFNSKEWKYVKDLIYKGSSDAEKRQALDILKIWKLRTPKLPSGVEGTLIVLEALLVKNAPDIPEHVLDSYYGTSLMRFINICGAKNDKQGTFYHTAKKNDLPDWLIDLRHELAHDQHLPSTYKLELGLNYCFEWLKTKYWDKQEENLEDFVIHTHSNEKTKDAVLLYSQLNLICHLNKNIKCLNDVGLLVPNLQEQISSFHSVALIEPDAEIKDVKRFLLKTVTEAIDPLNRMKIGKIIGETLIENRSIFIVEPRGEHENKFPDNFEAMWQDILNLLYSENMLLPFMEGLLKLTSKNETEEKINRNASVWLRLLFKRLLEAKTSPKKDSRLFPVKDDDNSDDEFNAINASKILKRIADGVKVLHKDILSNPNIYTLNFINLLLQFIEASEQDINKTVALVKLYLIPQQSVDPTWTVQTFDLPVSEQPNETVQNVTDDMFTEITPTQMEIENNDNEKNNTRRWRLVTDTSMFAGCPLGILPGQSAKENPLLFCNNI